LPIIYLFKINVTKGG